MFRDLNISLHFLLGPAAWILIIRLYYSKDINIYFNLNVEVGFLSFLNFRPSAIESSLKCVVL